MFPGILLFKVSSLKTGGWLQTFGDSAAAITFMLAQKESVFLTINQPGVTEMNEEVMQQGTEEGAPPATLKKGGRKKDPNAVKAQKAPKEPKVKVEPKPRGEGKLLAARELLETYRARLAAGEIVRKEVINELVTNHGINRGTANVQFGVVFGTTPRVKKEPEEAGDE